MMDAAFKTLPHCLGSCRIVSRGSEVSKGYKPDLTISDCHGQLAFIIECENKTDRKPFLGDLVKAEKHAEDCGVYPVLVIVMQEFPNTTVNQIANHLATYATWLARLKGGRLNLADIVVLSCEQYERSLEAGELLGSQEFLARTISAKRNAN